MNCETIQVTILQMTTPTLKLTLPNTVDLTLPRSIYFTIRDLINGTLIVKTGEDVIVDPEHTNVVRVILKQADTLPFKSDCGAKIRLQWIYQDMKRGGTKAKIIKIEENEIPEVLT